MSAFQINGSRDQEDEKVGFCVPQMFTDVSSSVPKTGDVGTVPDLNGIITTAGNNSLNERESPGAELKKPRSPETFPIIAIRVTV